MASVSELKQYESQVEEEAHEEAEEEEEEDEGKVLKSSILSVLIL